MKFGLYFRLFIISIFGALTISLISLYSLVRISDMAVEEYRYGYFMYIVRAIEKRNNYQHISKINVNKVTAPPEVKGDNYNLLKLTEFGPNLNSSAGNDRPRPSLWLVTQKGKILSTNTSSPLPIEWEKLKLPKKIHEIKSNEQKFLLEPKTFIVKLDTTPVTYLISYNERSLFQGPYLIIQGTHTFTTAALAVFLALSLTFYYLRRKSGEARKVLSKLGSGDLKARFEIKRFDEFGNLILDFNRMADEIERLVRKLQDTEISRSNLLQELGHDLRTPLTSLSTAYETLKEHIDLLNQEEKSEIFSMIGTDIRYFKDLLDKLTLIATIDGPHYKSTTEKINLNSLLETEVLSRQIASGPNLNWNLVLDDSSLPMILGDAHMITRLFRNAFDNAARYAANCITVKINNLKDHIEVLIMDDGPGLSDETIQSFGKRRERRIRKEKDPNDFSLGLGSVIMKTIAQVHGGQIEMKNLHDQNQISGACLKVVFNRF